MNSWAPRVQKFVNLTSNINKLQLHNIQYLHSNIGNNAESGVLDDYLIQLGKEKSEKWKEIAQLKKDQYDSKRLSHTSPWKLDLKNKFMSAFFLPKYSNINIEKLSTHELDSLFISALKAENFNDLKILSEKCVTYQNCPSFDVLKELLSVHSSRGDSTMVESLIELCRNKCGSLFHENHQFQHFIAKTIWVRGDIEKSVEMFVKLYFLNQNSRQIVRQMIKYLINDTVSYRSEASIIVLTKAMKMFGFKYNDWIFLSFLWEFSWLSEWFGDQQLADTLFNEHEPLRIILSDRLPSLSTIVLKDHQEDAILRLLHVLLVNDMMFCYTKVLEALFLYRYNQDDIYGCHEIVRNCVPLKIKLSTDLQTKYLTLLIKKGYIVKKPINENQAKRTLPNKIKYHFQFDGNEKL